MNHADWQNLRIQVQNEQRFAPLRHILEALPPTSWPACDTLTELSQTLHPSINLGFTPQSPRSRRKRKDSSLMSFIEQIADRRQVPTRERHPHDLFNFATFMMFPRSKLAIMDAHKHESLTAPDGSTGGRARTRTQDLLTLFDEGGAIGFGEGSIIFGHGIYEMIIKNDQPVRAITWTGLSQTKSDDMSWKDFLPAVDKVLADLLTDPTCLADSTVFPGRWIATVSC